MMKTVSLLIILATMSWTQTAPAAQDPCASAVLQGGVDILPWSTARPFPWDTIGGYWQLGDSNSVYIKAKVTSATNKRKILQLTVHADGLCSKASARGTGYVEANQKNVVRALVADEKFRYQFKIGLFDHNDMSSPLMACSRDVMAVSVLVLGRTENLAEAVPLDQSLSEAQNLVLKKVTIDVDDFCQK